MLDLRRTSGSPADATLDVSIVVPVFNEQGSLVELHARVAAAMDPLGKRWELLLVNDGSTDGSAALIEQLVRADGRVVRVELARNFGQTAALAAGFDLARGQVVITMDGDLQHDPAEIPRFLAAIAEGYDLVSGWRRRRVDPLLLRRVPSRAANWLIRRISGVELHDFATTFKAYRRELLDLLRLYGDMHRYIPAIASQHGARVHEIPIADTPRRHGRSNYGIERTFGVLVDLIGLRFFLKYQSRPLRFFGKLGLICWAATLAMTGYLLFDKFYFRVPIMEEHGPLAAATSLAAVLGAISIATGLICELVARTYFESTGRRVYTVRHIGRGGQADPTADETKGLAG